MDGSTHWSSRKLSLELGDVSHMTIARVWSKHGIKPHRLERYMASNDADFESKAADIIGLYLNPPQHAAIFSVDEKTAIQALDRKDPVLPLSPGRAERHGFEYYRHGTLSLYAALNTTTGEIIGQDRDVLFVGVLIGAVTFTGSIIAFGKLANLGKTFRLFSSAPIVFTISSRPAGTLGQTAAGRVLHRSINSSVRRQKSAAAPAAALSISRAGRSAATGAAEVRAASPKAPRPSPTGSAHPGAPRTPSSAAPGAPDRGARRGAGVVRASAHVPEQARATRRGHRS